MIAWRGWRVPLSELLQIWVGEHEIADHGDKVIERLDESARRSHRRAESVELVYGHTFYFVGTAEVRETALKFIDDDRGDRVVHALFDLDV